MLRSGRILIVFLVLEFLDECIGGFKEASWPLIRDTFNLSYFDIGLLVSIPIFISNVIEPILFITSDLGKRRVLIIAGGFFFILALLLTCLSVNLTMLLIAFMLYNPASGAFISISQTDLMEREPQRQEQNLVRWALAGSVGAILGPLLLTGLGYIRIPWQAGYGLFALLALITWLFYLRLKPIAAATAAVAATAAIPEKKLKPDARIFFAALRDALFALRDKRLLLRLVLLELSDLMLDIFYGFIALYFVDVIGVSQVRAGIAVIVWTAAGLAGDALIIPLLEKIKGLTWLRISACALCLFYPCFLLVPGYFLPLILLAFVGLARSGWYAVLQGQLFAVMPGKSGTALALKNLSGMVGMLIPLLLGLVAQSFGLSVAMWLLLLGPVAILLGLINT